MPFVASFMDSCHFAASFAKLVDYSSFITSSVGSVIITASFLAFGPYRREAFLQACHHLPFLPYLAYLAYHHHLRPYLAPVHPSILFGVVLEIHLD